MAENDSSVSDSSGSHHHAGHMSQLDPHVAHPSATGEVQKVADAGLHMAHDHTQAGASKVRPMIHDAQSRGHGAGHDHCGHQCSVAAAGTDGGASRRCGRCYSSTNPRRSAVTTAWVRSLACSLAMMALT